MQKLFFALLLAAVMPAFAKDNTVPVNSKLTEVTVYRTQSRLVHEADFSIAAGTTQLIVQDISTAIDPNSLQVFLKGKAELISATYGTDFLARTEENGQIKRWQDSLELLQDKLDQWKAEKTVYEEEQALLKSNQSLGNEKQPFTANDVELLANMFRRRELELKQKVLAIDKQVKQGNELKNNLQQQLNEVNAKRNQPRGQLLLMLHANQATQGSIKCAYTAGNSGWGAEYDLRSDGPGSPVTLVQKANVYQNTGMDWENVKLSICTGNPGQNNSRPILNPLYVNYVEYRVYKSVNTVAAPAMNMAIYDRKDKSGDEESEKYEWAGNVASEQTDNTVNVSYDLALRQDVPADGKAHTIVFDKEELQASYVYHTVPKMEAAAFLLAKVTDWRKYNLLPGNASIFLEGAYVGKSYINPAITSDTLLLSFGRDERINVKRTQITDLSSKKCVINTKIENYVYEIALKNMKPVAIEIEVLDQLPVSKQEDIKVDPGENSGAIYTSEIGKLEWKLTLAPNESKKLRFAYTLKYPKNKQVTEMNY